MKHLRLYPFTERTSPSSERLEHETFRIRSDFPADRIVPPPPNSTSGNSIPATWTIETTTYKPNPFHGLDRVVFAVDEWAHRHGLMMANHRPWALWRRPWLAPFAVLCNWWDRRMTGAE